MCYLFLKFVSFMLILLLRPRTGKKKPLGAPIVSRAPQFDK